LVLGVLFGCAIRPGAVFGQRPELPGWAGDHRIHYSIDQRVLKAPAAAEKSVADLAASISQAGLMRSQPRVGSSFRRRLKSLMGYGKN
jgi:hypothetical protein